MRIRWIKLIAGVLAAEVVVILLLVCMVALFGPKESNAAQAYAEKLGRWIGPLGGSLLSFLGALWIGRSLRGGQLVHGVLFGLFFALVDVFLLVLMQTPFEWIFVTSNVGKVLAGAVGGLVACRFGAGYPDRKSQPSTGL